MDPVYLREQKQKDKKNYEMMQVILFKIVKFAF